MRGPRSSIIPSRPPTAMYLLLGDIESVLSGPLKSIDARTLESMLALAMCVSRNSDRSSNSDYNKNQLPKITTMGGIVDLYDPDKHKNQCRVFSFYRISLCFCPIGLDFGGRSFCMNSLGKWLMGAPDNWWRERRRGLSQERPPLRLNASALAFFWMLFSQLPTVWEKHDRSNLFTASANVSRGRILRSDDAVRASKPCSLYL